MVWISSAFFIFPGVMPRALAFFLTSGIFIGFFLALTIFFLLFGLSRCRLMPNAVFSNFPMASTNFGLLAYLSAVFAPSFTTLLAGIVFFLSACAG